MSFACCLIVSVVALHLSTGNVQGCPAGTIQPSCEKQVMDVLGDFYSHLIFANAVTRQRHERHYGQLVEEAVNTVGRAGGEKISTQLKQVISLLEDDRYSDAIKMCNNLDRDWDKEEQRRTRHLDHGKRNRIIQMARTYLCYFRAEAHRLLGNDYEAVEQISDATRLRQNSTGVSVNELERLNGLIAIQRVSRFNKEIDEMFGLSPSSEPLRSVYGQLQSSTNPLIGTTRFARTLKDNSVSGHSVGHVEAKSILAEFAQKWSIIESRFSSDTDTVEHYASFLRELKQIDANFAKSLNNNIEKIEQASAAAERLIDSMRRRASARQSPRKEHLKTLETYAKYLKSDMYRRNADDWESLRPAELLLNEVKTIRQVLPGVSLGKIATLDGVIVLKLMKSFNKRITYVYQLNGGESDAELIDRRRHLGTCQKVLPPVSF